MLVKMTLVNVLLNTKYRSVLQTDSVIRTVVSCSLHIFVQVVIMGINVKIAVP